MLSGAEPRLDAPEPIGNAAAMFPIRDHNPSGRTPYVTWTLIAVNVGVFLLYWPALETEMQAQRFFVTWGLVPARLMHGVDLHTLLTSMFLHGGWMHIIGNMLFLWIFGDNMEDAFGPLGFLALYLCAGLAAAGLQVAMDPFSTIPMVGASGAIAGVLGGYLLLFPRARVDVLIILIIFFRILPVPAWIMLGLWFGLQILGGLSTAGAQGGVAFWAHAGGFVAGVALTVPGWLRRGGPAFWSRTQGLPPHPEARYRIGPSSIPTVRRRR
jgi:membrane associated rhomboid family serine protease